ncbi:hypothetical protein Sme01_54550 [Sphaerisporangium melleum]|uniref:Uncharacterized protein n=1 Tax=Sphaerisporangium melleum TaxID=321316 RepID=A0A917VK25_9ACTN|nr:hypothetical protein GCM10007964_38400 [Sphaerisporangium melleum]GII72979.1 hypothetical protein Sme01_54550 [Sphaerisporangium melleum]
MARAAYEYGTAVVLLAALAFAGTLGRRSAPIPATVAAPIPARSAPRWTCAPTRAAPVPGRRITPTDDHTPRLDATTVDLDGHGAAADAIEASWGEGDHCSATPTMRRSMMSISVTICPTTTAAGAWLNRGGNL